MPAPALERLVCEALEGVGVGRTDASAVAEVLLYANLRAIDSHGVRRLPNYIRRARLGLTVSSEAVAAASSHGPLRRLDAGHALGPPAALGASDLAAEIAQEDGIGLVALGRATHFGAAGFYAHRIAGRGLIALVLSNAPKAVTPYGGGEPFLGTNPIAIGAPLGETGRFVLDMSTSAVPKARIRRAMETGESLGPGWALDREGRPTTDPVAALAGSVLPLAGPKGFGLAFAIALFVGILGEAAFDDEMPSIYRDFERPQDLGQVFCALDPFVLTDRATATRRIESFVDRLHAVRPAAGSDTVTYCGEGADARARERARSGIPVPAHELEAIAESCSEAGLDAVAERALALRHQGSEGA